MSPRGNRSDENQIGGGERLGAGERGRKRSAFTAGIRLRASQRLGFDRLMETGSGNGHAGCGNCIPQSNPARQSFATSAVMKKPFNVTAIWDADAFVFTSQSDIHGLVVEANTFEEFVALVEALAPEVIAANVPSATAPRLVHVEACRELAVA